MANLMPIPIIYTSDSISKHILPILPVFPSSLKLCCGMEPAGMGRGMDGTAHSLSRNAGSAADE